ncbi:MAG: GNAT family N-acetyltransferase [Oligoflexia bacterium]|nr:GNAT family N-acetyltransferase [Oligoflexia bacterium]
MKKVIIDKATKNDMEDVAKIVSSSASWYEDFVEEKDMDQHIVGKEWIEENFDKRDFYVSKTEEGKNIGTITMQKFKDVTYLGYIYLDVNYVGKGIGQKMIQFAEEKSKEMGQKEMILIAHPEATWATRAYEKYGFKMIGEKKDEVLSYKGGLLEPYYEEGFQLYQYKLVA